MSVLRSLRRLRPIVRTIVALALLALQGALVSSTIWESQGTVTPVLHAEEQGARHLDMHDEQTCAVCQVRTLVAAPAESQPVPDAHAPQHEVPRPFFASGAVRELLSSVRSRAPPQQG